MPLYIPNPAWEQAPSMPRRPISLSAQGLGTFEAQSVHTGVLAQVMAKQVGCSRTSCATGRPAEVVSDFLATRKHRFAFTGHILIGRNLGPGPGGSGKFAGPWCGDSCSDCSDFDMCLTKDRGQAQCLAFRFPASHGAPGGCPVLAGTMSASGSRVCS